MKNNTCTCKWTSCKRYGDCEACIAHHSKHPKHPLPFCQKKMSAQKERRSASAEK